MERWAEHLNVCMTKFPGQKKTTDCFLAVFRMAEAMVEFGHQRREQLSRLSDEQLNAEVQRLLNTMGEAGSG